LGEIYGLRKAKVNKFIFMKKFLIITFILFVFVVIGGVLLFGLNREKSANLEPSPYIDIKADNPNFTAVKYLWREGVLERGEDLTFSPQTLISRAEWAEMLVKITGATPNISEYHDCFADVKKESFAPAVCYAKSLGWMGVIIDKVGVNNNVKFFGTLAFAADENFTPTQTIKNKEAVGSLARATNWQVEGTEMGGVTDEQATGFAEKAGIMEKGNAQKPITKSDGAGLVFKSVATVSFGQDKYDKTQDQTVEQYKLDTLVDANTKRIAASRKEEVERTKASFIREYAEIIGEKAAQEIAETSNSIDERLKKVRQTRHDQKIQRENAIGKPAPEINVLESLQDIFDSKEIQLDMNSIDMYKTDPADHENKISTKDPIIKAGEDVKILIKLDKQFKFIPEDYLEQATLQGAQKGTLRGTAYLMEIDIFSNYHDGLTQGKYRPSAMVSVEIINVETGVIEEMHIPENGFHRMFYWIDKKGMLADVINEAMHGIEGKMNKIISAAPVDEYKKAALPPANSSPSSSPTNQTQTSLDCNMFKGSWFPAMEVYDDGCSSLDSQVMVDGVTFNASFGLITEVISGWDQWVSSDNSISSGMSLGQKDSVGEFNLLPLGSYGVKSVRIPISYDNDNNEYQWVYAKYYVRYNKCETDLLISGKGPANDKSYGGKVTAVAEAKIKENVDKMKGLSLCK